MNLSIVRHRGNVVPAKIEAKKQHKRPAFRCKSAPENWRLSKAGGGAFSRRGPSSERAIAAHSRRHNGAAAVRLRDKTARVSFPHEAVAFPAAYFRASEASSAPAEKRRPPRPIVRASHPRETVLKIIPMILNILTHGHPSPATNEGSRADGPPRRMEGSRADGGRRRRFALDGGARSALHPRDR